MWLILHPQSAIGYGCAMTLNDVYRSRSEQIMQLNRASDKECSEHKLAHTKPRESLLGRDNEIDLQFYANPNISKSKVNVKAKSSERFIYFPLFKRAL